MDVSVSVVITTKNEENHIEKLLESIVTQTFQPHEIILVDNFSTDLTREIAAKYPCRLFSKGPERSAQRNFGMAQASGTHILYLDADMELTQDVILDCVQTVQKNPQLVGCYLPEKVMGRGYWIKVRRFERSFYNGTVVDAIRFFPRQLAKKVGGFDETLNGSEDWDFDKKMRAFGEVGVTAEPILHNEDGFTISRYLRKKNYYQPTWEPYVKKWGKNDPDIRRQLGFFYRYFGVFIEGGKFRRFVRHPLLVLGMYVLRVLVGVNYVWGKIWQARLVTANEKRKARESHC